MTFADDNPVLALDEAARLLATASTWEDVAFATGPADRAEAEAGARAAYRAAGLPEPEHVIWLDSPAVGAIAAALLTGGTREILESAGLGPLVNEVLTQLHDSIRPRNTTRSEDTTRPRDTAWRDDATLGDLPVGGRSVRDEVRTRPWEAARASTAAALGARGWPQAWALTGGRLWPEVNRLTGQLRTAIGNLTPSSLTTTPGTTSANPTPSDAATSGVTAPSAVASGVTASGAAASGITASGAAASDVTASGVTTSDAAASDAVSQVEALLRQVTLDAVLGQHDAPWLSTFDGLTLALPPRHTAAPTAGQQPDSVSPAGSTVGLGSGSTSSDGASSTTDGESGLPGSLAGLGRVARAAGWWWPYERVVLLCERPSSLHRDDLGRLHRADGAAVEFPDGFGLHAWHGMPVPAGFGASMAGLDAERIRREENAELRRVMLEHYGFDRFLTESGATPAHRDATGVLWRVELPDDEPLVMVEVVNSTPEPDGTSRTYFLRVPPWVGTAQQGVAWTFGLDAADYAPQQET